MIAEFNGIPVYGKRVNRLSMLHSCQFPDERNQFMCHYPIVYQNFGHHPIIHAVATQFIHVALPCCAELCRCSCRSSLSPYSLFGSRKLARFISYFSTGFHTSFSGSSPSPLASTHTQFTHYLFYTYVCMYVCVCAMLFTAGWFDGGGSLIVILLDFAFNWLSTACGVAKFAEHIYCQIHFLSTIYQSPCFLLLMLSLLFTRLLFLLLFWFENDKKSEWFGWNKALFCWFIKSVFVYYYFASFCKFSILNDVMMK